MITITFAFSYNGENYKVKACLKNDMTLSDSKQNEATDLIEDDGDASRWSLCFNDISDDFMVEIVMYRDSEGEMTTEPDYAIIWNKKGDYIEDTISITGRTTRN